MLAGFRRLNKFQEGLGARLPAAYKKFWTEWRRTLPAPVHYIKQEGQFERNPETGMVTPIQNVHIPLKYVPEEHLGIWGGEAIIKGFQKRSPYKRRVPHYWVPVLKSSVVRSEILDEHLSVTVTDRTIRLILENKGFDHYLLRTAACDLRSLLAIKLKKRMLEALQDGLPEMENNPKRQKEIQAEFGHYLNDYTPEEIEWYGLTFREAINKIEKIIKEENKPIPHKIIFRNRLVEQLREAGIGEAQGIMGAR